MRATKVIVGVATCAMVWAQVALAAEPVGTAFTYQGQLKQGGVPVNGIADFEFHLWDADAGGTELANNFFGGVSVDNGLFTVQLAFDAGLFDGSSRYLEVHVAVPSGGALAPLTGRQAITPVPYALYALDAPGGGDSWGLTGNAGTTPGANFVGTTDDQPLELRVGGVRALRIEPNDMSPNLIGGYRENMVSPDVVGATISGGGSGGATNRVTDEGGTIGGGKNNQAGDGAGTTIDAADATVAGGYGNTASGLRSTVSGGRNNTASGALSAIGGGFNNTASNTDSTIAGGASNDASGYISTIAGGSSNTASGDRSTVGGGVHNTANGYLTTIPGGQYNTASGSYSLAAGQRAQAFSIGTFVWSDSTTTAPDFFTSTGADQFLIKAAGGVGINTNAPGASLHIGGAAGVDGLMFPDGTLQTTAATGGGGGSLWSESGNDIFFDTGRVGIGTASPQAGLLHVVGAVSRAIYGQNTGATGVRYGVFGRSDSTTGRGVFGYVPTNTGANTGVWGQSSSTDGGGVYGLATASSGTTYGVQGQVNSADGYAGYFTGGRNYFEGNVGIGEANPAARLHLGGTPGVDGLMFPDGTLQTTAAVGGGGDSLWSQSGSRIYYNAGNVGIGTSNPLKKLHVIGDVGVHTGTYNTVDLQAAGANGGGGRILIRDSEGDKTIDLDSTGGSGVVSIHRPGDTGQREIFRLDAAWAVLNHRAPSGNGLISMSYDVAHMTPRILLRNADNQRTIYLQASEDGTDGARVELSQVGGTPTIVLDADYDDGMSASLGARVELNGDDGTTGLILRGRVSGGGLVQVNDLNGISRAKLGTFPTLGGFLTLRDMGGQEGVSIYADSNYGAHDGGTITLRDGGNDKLGLFANYEGSGFSRVVTDVIEIKGGADLSEQFDVTSDRVAVEPGMVVAIDPDHPGKLTVTDSPYDRKVAGIISGAGGVRPGMLMSQQGSVADGEHPIALTGRVWTLCDTSNGAIQPGDLLTTSKRLGHAMKVTDHARAQGAIIGKAMTKLEKDKGLVLLLVSLQ